MIVLIVTLFLLGVAGEAGVACLIYRFAYALTAMMAVALSIIHVISVAALGFGMYYITQRVQFSNANNWLIICCVLGIVFPIIGPFMLIMMFCFLLRQRIRQASVYSEYEQYINYEYEKQKQVLDVDQLLEEVTSGIAISPLIDILDDKDIHLRQGAIQVMHQLPTKDAVRLLQLSLRDSHAENRFFAAIGLSKIEGELTQNIVVAQEEVERKPDSANAHLALANSYLEYYESGLLDPLTKDYYQQLAYKQYKIVLELSQEQHDAMQVLNALANIEVTRKDYKSALEHFGKAVEIDSQNVYAQVGIAQVYYELGDMQEVKKKAQQLIDIMPQTKGIVREIIRNWAE